MALLKRLRGKKGILGNLTSGVRKPTSLVFCICWFSENKQEIMLYLKKKNKVIKGMYMSWKLKNPNLNALPKVAPQGEPNQIHAYCFFCHDC